MLRTLPRLALALVLAATAACGDDDDITNPSNSVDYEGIVASCVEGEIAVADETPQVEVGTVDDDDCFNTQQWRGRVEAWRLPQSAFGAETSLDIEVQAEFDAVILVLNEDGVLVDFTDEDIGDDLGHERLTLDFDEDLEEPTYYIAVLAWEGEPAGDYELTVGAIAPL